MRNLNKNMIKMWAVDVTGEVDVVDSESNFTGEVTNTYGSPYEIFINALPSNADIIEQIFGKDASVDKIAVSNTVVLKKDTLLFDSEPVSNFYTTYSYSVSAINKSLNSYRYGLRGRI